MPPWMKSPSMLTKGSHRRNPKFASGRERVAGTFPDLPCSRTPTRGEREVAHLTSLRLAGWKSIWDAKIELRSLNVLIGANGAGKSNLVGFFKLMNEMMEGRFQEHVGKIGGAESLLH